MLTNWHILYTYNPKNIIVSPGGTSTYKNFVHFIPTKHRHTNNPEEEKIIEEKPSTLTKQITVESGLLTPFFFGEFPKLEHLTIKGYMREDDYFLNFPKAFIK